MRVHISFHSDDRETAQEIAQQLRDSGHEPCFDSILEACGNILDNDYGPVAKKMRSYDYMIPIISERYLENEWLQKELFGACTYEQSLRTSFIIPTVLDNCKPPVYVKNPINLQTGTASERLKNLLARMIGLKQAFVIMKFGDSSLDDVFGLVYKGVCEEFDLHALRIDQVENSDTVSHQVLKSIDRSALIIADLTSERPNCYYEVGYADAKDKPIILTAKEGEKVHFDLAGRQIIFYKSSVELLERLKNRLASMRSEGLIPHPGER